MTRQDYKEQMEQQLAQWTTRLAGLQDKVAQAGAEPKKELLAFLAQLKQLHATGKQQLATFEAAAATKWEEAKLELADSWNQVSGAADAIWARVKQSPGSSSVATEAAFTEAVTAEHSQDLARTMQ